MNKKNGKRVLAAAIGASGLLVIAGIIFLIIALTQGWDIVGGLTSTTAFLWYGIIAVLILLLGGAVVSYFTSWRYK